MESFVQRVTDGLVGPAEAAMLWSGDIGRIKQHVVRCGHQRHIPPYAYVYRTACTSESPAISHTELIFPITCFSRPRATTSCSGAAGAVRPLKATLETALDQLASAPLMLMVKDFVVLACVALGRAGYRVRASAVHALGRVDQYWLAATGLLYTNGI